MVNRVAAEAEKMEWAVKVADGILATAGSPSKGPIYRNTFSKDSFPTLEGVSTTWELFEHAVSTYPENKHLGRRPIVDGKAGDFVFETYKEVDVKVRKVAAAYKALGLKAGGRVGIYGINCPEWFMAMAACAAQSIESVPLYDTLGADVVEYILNHAEVQLVVVQAEKIEKLLSALPKCLDYVKVVVSMSSLSAEQRQQLQQHSITALSWEELLVKGAENPGELHPAKPSDICTIMYTSGTTGEPKGVLLSHSSIIAEVAGLNACLEINKESLSAEDSYLSYLPLAHIFDRIGEETITYFGASIGYWQGDVKLVAEDIAALRPSFLVGVPRVFDRVMATVNGRIEAVNAKIPVIKYLFNTAYSSKLNGLKAGAKTADAAPFWDYLVFSRVRARLGGRVRLILSGAAPLAPHVEEFLRVTMGCAVVQGYGLTETNAGSFISCADQFSQMSTVGPPLPCVECRLESVPEMNYDAMGTPARGEVCIRGPTLFSGYYKREDLTKEAVDSEGWFHTGDIGEWQPGCVMKIIDRKKNIFKLAQGEYVAVENLENVYGNCKLLEQVWVYGNSFESVLVAVAVPLKRPLEEWAQGAGVEGDFEAICKAPAAKKLVLDELASVGKKAKLKGFEIIKAVYLETEPFDVDNDLLTPTMKKKRPQLIKHYQAQVDEMYAKLKASS